MTSLTAVHLAELARIADEDADPEEWCADAADFGANYLNEQGISASVVCGTENEDIDGPVGFNGCPHFWIKLNDGTIVDPTVSQFAGTLDCDDNEIDTWPNDPHVPSVAIVNRTHAFARNYVCN